MPVFCRDTATTEIYTLSLHDALPICHRDPDARDRAGRQLLDPGRVGEQKRPRFDLVRFGRLGLDFRDRKSTRLNSSHVAISYAVFCLKKKKKEHEKKHDTCNTRSHYT